MIDMSRLQPLIEDLSEYDQHQVENLFYEMLWERSEADYAIIDALIRTMSVVDCMRKTSAEFSLAMDDLEAHKTQAQETYRDAISKYQDNLEAMRTSDKWE